MYLHATFLKALPTRHRSWPGIIARALEKWFGGPKALRRSRWYDNDVAHRGF